MDHDLSFTEGTKPYIHDSILPTLTGICACGAWSREIHRFDAIDNPRYRAEIVAEHKTHEARLTSDVARWPAHGNGLHPLLNGGAFNGDRTEGEYRKLRIPLEAGGLAPGTTYLQLVTAIADTLMEAVEAAQLGEGVPLAKAPTLAAAYALMDQLKKHFPEVQAWRVRVRAKADPPKKDWTYLACHTQEEAEAYLPFVLAHLSKGRDEDSQWRYQGHVDLGPTELYRLQLPGSTPEIKQFG